MIAYIGNFFVIAYIGNFFVIAYIGNFSDASGEYRNVTLGKNEL